jgi:ABC-type lipoprotein release transport system permease subunit
MYRQASRATIEDEIAGGQYWQTKYDPFDPMTIDESHAEIPPALMRLIQSQKATPILLVQATIYPEGRAQSVLMRGADPGQTTLNLPTDTLQREAGTLPVMVGKLMARRNEFKIGSQMTVRWRDEDGTFDAVDAEVVSIMNTTVPAIDAGQLWVPLKDLQKMSGLENEATIIVVDENAEHRHHIPGWEFKSRSFLLQDIDSMVKSKRAGSVILYTVLLLLAMLAVFDTQVLAIFRRKKEIGTLMAMGMVRSKVISLFTLEGAMHGILGIALAAVYGVPVLFFSANRGIPMPYAVEDLGMAITTRLFPVYSVWLVGGTILIVLLTVTLVSYLPSRKISMLKPTDALKGKST